VTPDLTVYVPSNDTYIALTPMPTARYRHLACNIGSIIYYFGGRVRETDELITVVHAFNTVTGGWATLADAYPAELGSDNSCSTIGDTIYVMGGYSANYSTAFKTTYAFKPSSTTSVWTKKTGLLSFGRGDFASVSLSGKVYVYGGYVASDFCNPLSSVEVYDPVTDVWSESTSLPSGLAEKDDGVVIGGIFLAIGGETKSKSIACVDTDIVPLKPCYSFNPITKIWSNETTLPDARMRFAATSSNNVAYVFGGQGPVMNGNKNPILYSAYSYVAPSAANANEKTVPYAAFAGAVAGAVLVTFVVAFIIYRCYQLRGTCGIMASTVTSPSSSSPTFATTSKQQSNQVLLKTIEP
jgi:N-acetylneuraminic acid mutarotase